MWECVGEENQERATAGILVANQPGRLEGGDEAMDGRGVRASTERGNQTLSFGGNPATWPGGRDNPARYGRHAHRAQNGKRNDAGVHHRRVFPPPAPFAPAQPPIARPSPAPVFDFRWNRGPLQRRSTVAHGSQDMPRTADAAKRRGEYEYGEGGWKGRSGQKDRWPNRGQNISRRPSLRVPDARSIAALAAARRSQPRPCLSHYRRMCFPGKRHKDKHHDDPQPKPPAPPSTQPSAPTEPVPAPAMSPKVAIVIYSMYGHIATRMPTVLFPRPGRHLTSYIQSPRA